MATFIGNLCLIVAMAADAYGKLLRAVGDAVARENGFPFSRVECTEELTCHPALPAGSLPPGKAYIRASEEYERLRKKADAKGLAVDFVLGSGKPLIVRTHCEDCGPETTEFGVGMKTVRRTHYFEVGGYRSRKESLLESIDGLSEISEVEKAIEPKENPKIAFALLDEFYGHYDVETRYGEAEPKKAAVKNSARLLGLDREETYSGMRKLAKDECQAKMKELEASATAKLLGTWYRQARTSKIRRLYHEKLRKISKMKDVLLPEKPGVAASQGPINDF